MLKLELVNDGISKALSGIAGKVTQARPLMLQIAGVMADSAESNFSAQGRPKWAALSKESIEQRRKSGSWPGSILQESGRLASSIQSKATDTEAIVGTNVKYAAIHQLGGTINIPAQDKVLNFKKFNRGANKGKVRFSKESKASFSQKIKTQAYSIKIPARPFLTVTPKEITEMRRLVIAYIKSENL